MMSLNWRFSQVGAVGFEKRGRQIDCPGKTGSINFSLLD